MTDLIPAINADTFEEVKQKLKLVEPYFSWAQVDVADGSFTKNTIWHNPQDLVGLETSLNIELHLMITDIERRVEEWFFPCVKRIIFHVEASDDPEFVIDKIKKSGRQVGLAISPETSWIQATPFKDKLDLVQFLGVNPGLPGQKTQEDTFRKIKEMRDYCSSCIIEVDGGMNMETVGQAIEAGANVIVSANAIFSGDVSENIKELRKIINN